MSATLLGFVAAFALILLRVPIAMALALVGFAGMVLLVGLTPALAASAMAAKANTMAYTLSVLPLFVLMGNLVAGAGVSGRLFQAAQLLVGRRRGGVAMATVLACGGFGAICGSSVATAATMSRVAVPAMREIGYADKLAAATVAAGGTLGILIPPSVIMVVYGVGTQTHIGKLFAAGIVPGVIAVAGYMLAVRWVAWRHPGSVPAASTRKPADVAGTLRGLWPVALLFGLVMGGIYGGWFTATEAAGIGAAGALAYALTRHSLGWRQIREILEDTALTSAGIFALVLGAAIFADFVNLTDLHKSLLDLVNASGVPPFGVILIIVAIYIVLGCVLESLSIILLTVPIFFPVVVGLGYDPVWFGIIVVVATEIGLITPPIGVNLFVIRSVVPDIAMRTIIGGITPFVVSDVVRVVILAALPVLSLWLPGLMFGN